MSRESTATPGRSAASPSDASRAEAEAPHAAPEGAGLSGQPWTLRVRGKERRVRSLRSTLRNPWVWVATVAALATGFAGRSAYDMLFNTDREAYVSALMQARRAAGQEQAARAIAGQGSLLARPSGAILAAAPPAGATSAPAPGLATATPAAVANGPVVAGGLPAPAASQGLAGSTGLAAAPGTAVGARENTASSSVGAGLAATPGVGAAPGTAASTGLPATPVGAASLGPAMPSGVASGAVAAAIAVPPTTTANVSAAAAGLAPDGNVQPPEQQRADTTARERHRRHGPAQSRVTANRRALFTPPPGIEPTPYGVGAGLTAPGQVAYDPVPGQGDTGDSSPAAHAVRRPQRERETLSARERAQLAQRRHQSSSSNPSVIDAIKNIFQDISSRHVVPLRPEDKTRP